MEFLILFLKGFIIGIAKIIPGVSGALIAISFGIYEKALKAIGNFFKNPIDNFLFLFPIGLGVLLFIFLFISLLSISLTSSLIIYLINNYYLSTMLLFIGLIMGGIPNLIENLNIKKINFKHILILIFTFSLVFLISLVGNQNFFIETTNHFTNFILFFIIGIIDAMTMIIPGISGTAVMMILGCYNLLLSFLESLTSVSNILNNIFKIIPYFLGIVLCVIFLSKLMTYLFNKKKEYMYWGIVGFTLSSILSLFFATFKNNYSFLETIIGLIWLYIGYKIARKLE